MIEDRSTANADPSGKTTYVFQDRAGKPGGGKGPLVSNGYYPTMTGHPFMMCTEEVYAFEGNGSRPSHKGVGFSDDGVMYTLNTTEVHGVMYPEVIAASNSNTCAVYSTENVPTLKACDYKAPPYIAIPIDRRNECREKSDNSGIGKNGDPMYTLTASLGESGIKPLVFTDERICLMDQGGQIMNVMDDQTGTIRAEMGGHAPIVLENNIYYNHPQASLVTEEKTDVCQTLTKQMGTGGGNVPLVREPFRADREPFVYDSHPMDSRVTPCTKNCQTLSTRFGQEYSPNTILVREKEMNEMKYVVRRITPKECERLQGFPTKGEIGPDGKVMERDYTDIPWPKGQCPDSHRYKALGNSMSTNVMRLIAESIDFALSHPITEDKSDKIAYQTSLFDF